MLFLILAMGYLVSVGGALLLTPLLRDYALRRGWVDDPQKDGKNRKVHGHPVPRVGGVAIMGGFAAGLLYFAIVRHLLYDELALPSGYFLLGAALIGAVGFYDDVRGLGFKRKFMAQVAIAFLMVWGGYRIGVPELLFFGADIYQEALVTQTLTLLWIVGIINAVNLLDGLDGLAAGVVIIAFASLGAAFSTHGNVASLGLMIAAVGATIGFLFYNFHPASIFMGDSGSMFLGYLLAVYSIEGTSPTGPSVAFLVPLIALGLPLVDTLTCMLRRFMAGHSPFAPDRDHIHHRIVGRLHSHRNAVLVLYAIALAFGALAVLQARAAPLRGIVLLLVTATLVYALLQILGYNPVPAVLRVLQRRRAPPAADGEGREQGRNGRQAGAEQHDSTAPAH